MTETENTDKNSKPWQFQKGQSGNPAGRPVGSLSIVSELKKRLEEVPEGQEKTYLQQFIDGIMEKTIDDKDVNMMRDVINRVDGMPTQKIDSKVEIIDGLNEEQKAKLDKILNA
jgi:hypothetical protein